MPATLFSDLEFSANQHQNKVIEDTRALQVALELSMLYMNGEQRQQKAADNTTSGGPTMDHHHHHHSSSPMSQQQNYIPNGFPEEPRNKKSQNMTECVPVPSSEHVAEIVGRQGNILTKHMIYYIPIRYTYDRMCLRILVVFLTTTVSVCYPDFVFVSGVRCVHARGFISVTGGHSELISLVLYTRITCRSSNLARLPVGLSESRPTVFIANAV